MAKDNPTGSVPDRREGEWNRRGDHEGDTSERSHEGAATRSAERPAGGSQRRRQWSGTVDERDDEQDLEAALRRKDRQLQVIRERYERILTERNRKLQEASRAEDDGDERRLPDLLGRLRER